MGVKGDKSAKEPIAINLYAQGKSLTEISGILKVSITTLSTWKTDSKRPDSDIDEWDRARQQKQSTITRLKNLYEEQIKFLEEQHPSERTSRQFDGLSKLGALVERWDKFEKAQVAAKEIKEKAVKGGLSEETIREIEETILGIAK